MAFCCEGEALDLGMGHHVPQGQPFLFVAISAVSGLGFKVCLFLTAPDLLHSYMRSKGCHSS
jgi:hypothetical protein